MRLAFGGAILACALAGVGAHAQDTIRIGEPNWFSGKVVAGVLEAIIEDRFNVQAEVIPGTNPEIFAAIDDNTDAYHIHADVWMPGHSNWVEPARNDGDIALSSADYDGRVGICAPRYTVEALNLRSVSDMGRPDVVEALDTDGDGRIPYWVGGEGWQMSAVGQVKLRDYGLSNAYDALITSESEFQASLFDALSRRDHIVFACYEPISWFAMDFIDFIEEPAYDPNNYTLVLPSEADDWLQKSRITTAEELSSVSVGFATSIAEDHPDIAAFLSRFGLTNDDITEFMFMADIKQIDMEFVIEDWVQANSARIDAWVNG
jgi:glycine betaine/proline transport system substrate-binding protein